MNTLQDKVAVVTGGGTGIGKAIAIELARSGARIAVIGRRTQLLQQTVSEVQALGAQAWAFGCDLTSPTEIEELSIRLSEQFTQIDILINNAGSNSKVRSSRYIDADEWRAVMDVNTLGPAMLTKQLLPAMLAKGSGDVVLISSMAAIRASVMAGVAYSAAKTAAHAYMEVLAQEVRNAGVRCITIFPGEVDTAILDDRALPPPAAVRALLMQPEDIAAAVLMAVSLPRRAMVTELAMSATIDRDTRDETQAAMNKKRP